VLLSPGPTFLPPLRGARASVKIRLATQQLSLSRIVLFCAAEHLRVPSDYSALVMSPPRNCCECAYRSPRCLLGLMSREEGRRLALLVVRTPELMMFSCLTSLAWPFQQSYLVPRDKKHPRVLSTHALLYSKFVRSQMIVVYNHSCFFSSLASTAAAVQNVSRLLTHPTYSGGR
jgi:hypothetical protein